MKTSFRIVALVLMLTVLCTACILAVFASSPDTATEESIPAKNQIIQQINCDLRISGSTAVLLSDVKGTAGSTTKCEIELKLQKNSCSGGLRWKPGTKLRYPIRHHSMQRIR